MKEKSVRNNTQTTTLKNAWRFVKNATKYDVKNSNEDTKMEQPQNPQTPAVKPLTVCSVKDQKVGVYFQPFFARTKAEAMRTFQDLATEPEHMFAKHPEDFVLFLLSEWNEDNGYFDNMPTPIALCRGSDFIKLD